MTFNINSAKTNCRTFSYIPLGYDIYALGFEEVGSFIPVACIKKQKNLTKSLKEYFGTKYSILCDVKLLAIKLIIILSTEILDRVKLDFTKTIDTGAEGIYGNKGASVASITVDTTKYMFIASHFAAHQSKVDERNGNYATIMNSLSKQLLINPLSCYHYIFFVGDLNYRIGGPYFTIKQLATAGKYFDMLEYDQLTTEKRAMNVFSGFNEEDIHFPPTYKFNKSSVTYDTSKKLRVPSFTDRILYYTHSRKFINVQEYNTNMDILISDHRPVYAKFITQLVNDNEESKEQLLVGNQNASTVCNVA